MSADDYKRQAAARAVELIEPGMKIGLGTGSTAAHMVDLLGARVKAGLKVLCVPTSEATAAQARALGIPLTTLDDEPTLDLTIDGADELDRSLQLIKGGGGALLREKIVATASEQMIVIADHTKLVERLGRFPLPLEVVRFGYKATREMIADYAADAGCSGDIKLRLGRDGQPYITDGGNYIYDCAFDEIEEAELLDGLIKLVPGVVENGLFIGIATKAIIAGPNGVEEIDAEDFGDDDF